MQPEYDAIIVGGGAAGLSAALMLGRSRRRVVVVDSGLPRNRAAAHLHGYLGSDGIEPAELLARGRREVTGCGVKLLDGRVTDIDGTVGAFTAALEDGAALTGRRVVIATGLIDVLPDVPGLVELWGQRVFHCPYCHGWELRDRSLAVLALDPWAGHGAVMLTPLSADLTLFGDISLAPHDERAFAARGGRIVRQQITAIEPSPAGGVLVRLVDGSVHERDGVFVTPRPLPNDQLLRALGCAVTSSSVYQGFDFVEAGPTGETSVPGVYAVGNSVDISAQLIQAAAAGAKAGQHIATDLLHDEIEALFLASGSDAS
ncbi:NAD(P)/FAD-dependent oxidoreductase [Lysobacter korlensis]|uniref:NAD(P)/FAD-dependent oxidoreductase n=1 Tax=Lysobacter korlensis TaxID=553636 RepID=A0ABV6RVY0_9GAMM